MRLAPDWSAVLRKAWSVRFIAAAFVFSVAEIALPMLDGYVDVPPRLFAVLTGLSAGGAFVTRLLAQSNLGGSK